MYVCSTLRFQSKRNYLSSIIRNLECFIKEDHGLVVNVFTLMSLKERPPPQPNLLANSINQFLFILGIIRMNFFIIFLISHDLLL